MKHRTRGVVSSSGLIALVILAIVAQTGCDPQRQNQADARFPSSTRFAAQAKEAPLVAYLDGNQAIEIVPEAVQASLLAAPAQRRWGSAIPFRLASSWIMVGDSASYLAARDTSIAGKCRLIALPLHRAKINGRDALVAAAEPGDEGHSCDGVCCSQCIFTTGAYSQITGCGCRRKVATKACDWGEAGYCNHSVSTD